MAKKNGDLIKTNNDEWLYDIPNLYTYCLDNRLNVKRTKAQLFVQRYKGKLIKIVTKRGNSIKATKEHPLLVSERGVLKWKKLKDINIGDYIAISQFKVPPKKIELENDVVGYLKKKYPLVMTYNDYNKFKRKTNNFTKLDNLTIKEFNILRILGNFSHKEIANATDFSCSWIQKILSGEKRITNSIKATLIKFFKNNKNRLAKIERYELLVGYKARSGKKNYTKFIDVKYIDEDIVKWFAFVLSEGHAHYKRIVVAQKKYKELLEEFGKISKRKFNIIPKKTIREDGVENYEIYSKPFREYLYFKFNLKIGSHRESPICDWVLSLPYKLQALFLKYFFALECDVQKNIIRLTQVSKRNINIISTMLNNFGIEHRLKINYRNNKGIEYLLSIDGRDNLRKFIKNIKIYDLKKLKKVNNYLRSIKLTNPSSFTLTPINSDSLKILASIIPRYTLKNNYYYYKNNKINRKILDLTIRDVEKWLSVAKQLLNNNNIRKIIKIFKIDKADLSRKMGYSRSYVDNSLKHSNTIRYKNVIKNIHKISKDKIRAVKAIYKDLVLLSNPFILWEKVIAKDEVDYDDYIVDLIVPKYHNFIAGFGGVVCHNTTLVEAITGRWAAQHSEELKRGITIKLGYADATIYKCEKCFYYSSTLKCPKCFEDCKPQRTISFVDAPGHETLMATVLAGASLMDGVLLTIAANEKCPQPQTKEHLMALEIVGIKSIIIVQTKIDLVLEEQSLENYKQIKEFVKGTIAENAPIIPVSAQHKINISYLLEAIQLRIPTPQRDTEKPPKMFVVRSFDINKPGTKPENVEGGVLGGSLIQGKLKLGDEIEIKPGLQIKDKWITLKSKVVGLQKAGKNIDEAGAGGLLGVQTQLDPSLTKADSLAGSLAGKELPPIVNKISMKFELLKDKLEPIKVGEVLMLNIGTGRTIGTVKSVKKSVVDIDLKLPICFESGNRAVISRRIADKWKLIGYSILN